MDQSDSYSFSTKYRSIGLPDLHPKSRILSIDRELNSTTFAQRDLSISDYSIS